MNEQAFLKDLYVVVAGGTSGRLGARLAQRLEAHGANVVPMGREQEVDLTSVESINSFYERNLLHEQVAALVVVAGGWEVGDDVDRVREMFEKNVVTAVNAVNASRRWLAKNANVVLIGAQAADDAVANQAGYNIAKVALRVFARTLNNEASFGGRRAHVVAPRRLDDEADMQRVLDDIVTAVAARHA